MPRTPQKHPSITATPPSAPSSASPAAAPPARLTRGALKRSEEGEARLAPALKNPEPRKGRKRYRTIVIDYTEGAPRLFRDRARQIKTRLRVRVAQLRVDINRHDERPGCFVVQEEGDQVFLELLDMEDPFEPLRDLDVNNLVEGIKNALLSGTVFEFRG